MLWFLVVFLVLLVLIVASKAGPDRKLEEAKALRQRLSRETPDDELTKIGEDEFVINYRKSNSAARTEVTLVLLAIGLGSVLFGFSLLSIGPPELALPVTILGAMGGLGYSVVKLVDLEKTTIQKMRAQLDGMRQT